MARLCSIESCGDKHYARGWCQFHYLSWYHHGDPLAAKVRPPWQHGTVNGYNNHLCRCDACRKAIAAYARIKRAGTCSRCGGHLGNKYRSRHCRACHEELCTVPHPSLGHYERGCHCEECRKLSAASRRGRRQRAKERAAAVS